MNDCAGDVETHFSDADGADELAEEMRDKASKIQDLLDQLEHDMYIVDQLNRPVQ